MNLTKKQMTAVLKAVEDYTTYHCRRVREDLAKNRLPSYFSASVCRTRMQEALIASGGRKLNGGDLLLLGAMPEVDKAYKRTLKREGFRYVKRSAYVWPKDY